MKPPRIAWAIALWAVILSAIGLRLALSRNPGSVYPIFATAGVDWRSGDPIYRPWLVERDLFRYSPTVAAWFAPLSMLPRTGGELLWRLIGAGVLFGGVAAWSRWWWDRPDIAAMLLLIVPLAIGGLNNGQANALIAGLLLLSQVAFARERYSSSSACIAICVLFKGYPIALGMLLTLLAPRRFGLRFGCCLIAGFALPFLLQRPEYVFDQYREWFARQAGDNRTNVDPSLAYRDLHQLLQVAGIQLSLTTYRLLEVLLAAGAAAIVWFHRVRWSPKHAVWACGALAACWMTLAGPATESCTWVLTAPLLAQLTIETWRKPGWERGAIVTSFALFTLGAMVVWFPGSVSGPVQRAGVQPLAGALLTIVAVARCCQPARNVTACLDYFFVGSGRSASSSRTGA